MRDKRYIACRYGGPRLDLKKAVEVSEKKMDQFRYDALMNELKSLKTYIFQLDERLEELENRKHPPIIIKAEDLTVERVNQINEYVESLFKND